MKLLRRRLLQCRSKDASFSGEHRQAEYCLEYCTRYRAGNDHYFAKIGHLSKKKAIRSCTATLAHVYTRALKSTGSGAAYVEEWLGTFSFRLEQ